MPPRWPITAPAAVTLAGLRIDRAERTPAALHDQLIPWHRIASLHETRALPLDPRGRPLRHDGRRVSLKLPSSRAGRLADRALHRAIARAFNDGSITIRGDWSRAVWGEVLGIAFMTSAVIALFVLAAIGLFDLARALIGSPDAMVSLGVLVVVLGGVVLCSYVSIVLLMLRQMSTLRLYATLAAYGLFSSGAGAAASRGPMCGTSIQPVYCGCTPVAGSVRRRPMSHSVHCSIAYGIRGASTPAFERPPRSGSSSQSYSPPCVRSRSGGMPAQTSCPTIRRSRSSPSPSCPRSSPPSSSAFSPGPTSGIAAAWLGP